ncbi:MAG: M50 family metallopeptidase [Gemmatimonadota bacterium]
MATKKPKARPVTPASLAGFAAFFAALWFLWDTPAVLPLKLFVVFLHEISHGIAAVASGGRIDRIVIAADQSGACYCGGGSPFITLSAGYLGSLAWGLVLVWLARFERLAPWTTAAVGVVMCLVTLLYVRTMFGLLFGLGGGAALLVAARRLPVPWNARLLYALGLTSALYAILDIKSDVIDRPELDSDARMLAELTGVPTVVWGSLWIGIALGVVYLVTRRALARGPR